MAWTKFDGKTIFDLNRNGAIGCDIERTELNIRPNFKERTCQLSLSSMSEIDVLRHFIEASKTCHGVENGIHVLGSCSMKYNPKVNEYIAEKFKDFHPLSDAENVQGCLEIIFLLQEALSAITGLDYAILSPAAGAHAELISLMMIKEYHKSMGNDKKTKVIIPDSAHGTNESSASLCKYEIVKVNTTNDGYIKIDEIIKLIDDKVAALLITNPNTMGIFEKNIKEISDTLHKFGAILYCDGANYNALIGKYDMKSLGIDIMHLNLHKTFSTPHGGGGPGCGAICFKEKLSKFIPYGMVENNNGKFDYKKPNQSSVGRIKGNNTINFPTCVKALAYIISIGILNIKNISESTVLSANYAKNRLQKYYHCPLKDANCMHEFLLTDKCQKEKSSVTAKMIAQALIEKYVHPMTIYFPTVYKTFGSMLIEITETESKQTIDEFIEKMIEISNMKIGDCAIKSAPVQEVDELAASKNLI